MARPVNAKVVGIFVLDSHGANSDGSISGNDISHVDIGVGVYGDIIPTGIAIFGNTVTNLDTHDPYAAGVDFEPTHAALATPFHVTGTDMGDFLQGAAGADQPGRRRRRRHARRRRG